MKTAYFVDVHIINGNITRFYHRVSEDANVKLGVILPGPEHKFIRFSTTKQCYLSYLKYMKPYVYKQLANYERR